MSFTLNPVTASDLLDRAARHIDQRAASRDLPEGERMNIDVDCITLSLTWLIVIVCVASFAIGLALGLACVWIYGG